MKNIKSIVAVVFFAITFVFLGILVNKYYLSALDDKVLTAYKLIQDRFDGDQNQELLTQKLLEGLGDEYSYYVNSDTYKIIKQENEGEYVGIGLAYSFSNNELKVIEVFPQTPAESTDIKPGDKILDINDHEVKNLITQAEISALFKGKEGEEIKLTIETSQNELKEVVLKRTKLNLPSLSFKQINPETAYLKIYQFRPKTDEEFMKIVNDIQEKNYKNIIIDLRNNLGGNTEVALYVEKQFINSGVLLIEKFKNGGENITRADGDAPFVNLKVAVLVNHETSSAAELMAAAFKDNKRSKIIGEQTFGKSSIGNYFEFEDGSVVHLTIGHWLTPNGESIHGKGVEPDIFMEDNLNGETDAILEKALESF